jgi:sulfane dehydrogenase subunit SoxC
MSPRMPSPREESPARRRFLQRTSASAAGLASLLAAKPAAAEEALAVPPWTREPGEPVLWRAYGQPDEHERGVVRTTPRSCSSGWP